MTPELLLAFALFACVTSITPGPNNTMILASGLNFGLRRSLPHLLGISLGFGVMVAATGFGLHAVFERWPALFDAMRWAGAAYLLWLAWQLARSGPLTERSGAVAKPMGFFSAAAFQWVNPKAWVMAVSAISNFLPAQHSGAQVALIAALFALINVPCVASWAAFGSRMRNVLRDPVYLRLFNGAAALALVASLYPLLTQN
jgi:threonine/homoserine/homoserine lactone efflux protein